MVTNRVAKNKVQLLHSEKLGKLAWLVHAFSTRHGGVSRVYGGNALNLGFTPNDSRAAVERNRKLFLKELGVANGRRSWPLVSLRQIHSDLIHRVDRVQGDRMPEQPLAGDGMVTDTPGLVLAVQTADCLPIIPIILADRKRRAVGVFHAGWRGTVERIVEKGVGEMRKHFKSDPRDLVAAIGPGVQGCCYEVGEEVRTKFEAQFAYASSLFRQVKESDPVREKYPLLFLTARGHQVPRVALEMFPHLTNTLLDDPFDRAAPACMKNADSSPFSIRQNDGVSRNHPEINPARNKREGFRGGTVAGR